MNKVNSNSVTSSSRFPCCPLATPLGVFRRATLMLFTTSSRSSVVVITVAGLAFYDRTTVNKRSSPVPARLSLTLRCVRARSVYDRESRVDRGVSLLCVVFVAPVTSHYGVSSVNDLQVCLSIVCVLRVHTSEITARISSCLVRADHKHSAYLFTLLSRKLFSCNF